jgi:UDP-N-acetylglucosamine 1-carboxyvinyltransferase
MDSYLIEGGYPLNGEVRVQGSKNVALKVLIASLLTKNEVVVKNVPFISDLFTLIDVIRSLGVKIDIKSDHTIVVNSANLQDNEVSGSDFVKLRASFLLMVPLMIRLGKTKIPVSGGDNIGVRPIDRTIDGLRMLGAKIDFIDGYYYAVGFKMQGGSYHFKKNTHTGTEAMIMASVLIAGETVLFNASEEPEVDELIKFLNLMGAKIKRRKKRMIVIQGVKKLYGAEFYISADRNEAVTFAIAGFLTSGKLEINSVDKHQMAIFNRCLTKINACFKYRGQTLIVDGTKKPFFSTEIATSPYPGFMTDWQAPWTLLMTQAEGVSVVWEKIYENRFGYIFELIKMGAKIELFNPIVLNPEKIYNFNLSDGKDYYHAAKIIGPVALRGTNLIIPDLRAGATLVLAAMTACGESSLMGVNHIDRGYENFDERLRRLGAKITRFKEV